MTVTKTADLHDSAKPTNNAFETANIRPDRLGELFADGLIGETQYHAGRKWQARYISSEGDPRAPRTLQFREELQRIDKIVGPTGVSLLCDVLDTGYSIEMAAIMRGDKRGAEGWREVLCAYLTKLADATSH